MVPAAPVSFSCSDAKPCNHPLSYTSPIPKLNGKLPSDSTASLLFLEQNNSTPGPLHLLFLLPDTLCTTELSDRFPPSLRSLLKCHLLREVFPWLLSTHPALSFSAVLTTNRGMCLWTGPPPEGGLSQLPLYPQHPELCPHSRLTTTTCSSDRLLP